MDVSTSEDSRQETLDSFRTNPDLDFSVSIDGDEELTGLTNKLETSSICSNDDSSDFSKVAFTLAEVNKSFIRIEIKFDIFSFNFHLFHSEKLKIIRERPNLVNPKLFYLLKRLF